MAQQVRARRKKKSLLSFVNTCGAGLEGIVADEITLNGGEVVESKPGAVAWRGNLEAGYCLCLWSRFASRILLQIAEFEAPDPDTLYKEAGKIDWDEHFNPRNTFAVYCTLSGAQISHSQFAALRIKDAIVDQFRSRTGRRPDVDVHQPGMRFNLHIEGSRAVLALDLSGDSLHRRGYRVAAVEAPMKETLAAAIVQLSGWTPSFSPIEILLDPMCGSGTLLIEAAMIYGDSAPGLQRKTFGFMYWPKHDARLWEKLVNEALAREEKGLEKKWPRIIGYDADPQAVAAARKNICQAGLEDKIEISQRQFADIERPADGGMVLMNPPYGERLSDREEVKYLYRCIGRKFSESFHGWRVGFFASNPDFSSNLGVNWTMTAGLFNGPIKCKLHCGTPEQKQEPGYQRQLGALPPGEGHPEFTKCLINNCSALFPWAEQQRVSCFRIYNADLPEYDFTVDLYEEWVHVCEYGRGKAGKKAKEPGRMLQDCLEIIRQLLDVPPSRLFINNGQRNHQKKQQGKKGGPGKPQTVREDNCRFLVNFTNGFSTGLLLDHRTIRRMIGSLARGKKFLNLYGEAGPATIYAIMGGAVGTTTVDSSPYTLQRLRANMALNGLGGPQHKTIQKDSLQLLREGNDRYGLIFVHSPAFSAHQLRKPSLNIQQDHEKLLHSAMQRLARGGLLIFSLHQRKFKLSNTLLQQYDILEITDRTVPEDFRGTPVVHRCWEFRHRTADDS